MRRRQRCAAFGFQNREGADRLGDVLVGALAEGVKGEGEFVADLVVDAAGDADAARLSGGLKAGGNVNAVAEKILPLHHDVAEIDANAEADLAVGRKLVVASAQSGLDVGGTTNGFDSAGKFGEDGVARGVEDAAAVHGDERFEDFLVAAEGAQRVLFVFAHQAAEFGHVGGENGGELAFERLGTRFGRFAGHRALQYQNCGTS